MVDVLGISVEEGLIDRWTEWFAPVRQPFRLTDALVARGIDGLRRDPVPEVRDTFHMYDGEWIWLTESEFLDLHLDVRRALLRGRPATGRLSQLSRRHRDVVGDRRSGGHIVWWPDLVERVGRLPVFTYVLDGVRPSLHAAIEWAPVRSTMPGAAELAGTFPEGSGPNCFGTVMAAAGVPDMANQWVRRDPFERWLGARCEPVYNRPDETPGVVLVWRDRAGDVEHAAVTIGGGYALVKPSQAWCSPRVVWTVEDTITAGRSRGLRLERHRIQERS